MGMRLEIAGGGTRLSDANAFGRHSIGYERHENEGYWKRIVAAPTTTIMGIVTTIAIFREPR